MSEGKDRVICKESRTCIYYGPHAPYPGGVAGFGVALFRGVHGFHVLYYGLVA